MADIDQTAVSQNSADDRIAQLEQALQERDGQLAQQRAEMVRTQVLAEAGVGLPRAYQALVAPSADADAVRVAVKEAVEQYQTDMAAAQKASPARAPGDLRIGAPSAGLTAAPLPRWHGRKPSEVPVEDWPAYRREVLGLR